MMKSEKRRRQASLRVISSAHAMSRVSRRLTTGGKTIALVPTMGALHQGHLSLVRRAKRSADVVVVSIFVNPLQFGPREDFRHYPRNIKRDLALLRTSGADYVFTPEARRIYLPEFHTTVAVSNLTDTLEGAIRPGHFDGVTTVVAILFNICRPDFAVFGQKDYQQVEVLQRMTVDLGYPLKFIVCPTVRERDGLAMSSRNAYFDSEQRREAVCLYRGLVAAKETFTRGVRNVSRLQRVVADAARNVCPSIVFDYIAITERHTLEPVATAYKGNVLSVAARVHNVRLIDNIIL